MKTKKIFQEFLVKSGLAAKYVKNHRLDGDIVTTLIREKKDDILLEYIKIHLLDEAQVTEILYRDKVDELMLAVAKQYVMTPEQQEIIVEKKNVLLWETYLCPKGFFDKNRRFASLPEYKFIYGMVKSEKLIGLEVFKTYVDSCYRSLLTPSLIDLFIANENSYATRYIFSRARLKRDWEEDFVEKANVTLLKCYIDVHELATDDAQIALIRKDYALARVYYDKYKFRTAPAKLYHDLRQQEIDKKA